MTFSRFILFNLCLLMLLSPIITHNTEEHTCNHDDLEYVAEDLDVEEDMSSLEPARLLQSTTYPNMRIKAHYDFLNTAPASFKAYIQNDLAPAVLDFLSAALKVKYPIVGQLKVGTYVTSLCGKQTPTVLKTGVDADFYMIFDHRVEDSTVVASSQYCQLASGTKRPLIGYTNFNRNMLQEPKGDVLLHEKNMYLLIHEIFHVLGISKNSFSSYLDEFGRTRTGHIKTLTIGGVTQSVIHIPALTQRLRNFYGCSTIPGLIMENNGGSGTALSHLERKFFVYETMASGGIFGRRVSEFSLALLEGSGWYVPDYNYAEPYMYGKGQGCTFVTQVCSSTSSAFSEFCVGSNRGCAPTGRGGGYCTSDSNSNGCKYVNPYPYFDCDDSDAEDYARFTDLEVYGRGANSKCFTGTLNSRLSSNGFTSFCFKYECSGEGATAQLQVVLGSQKVICDKKGQKTINGYYGYIDCPDPVTFCSGVGKPYCPRGCLGRGTCGPDARCVCKEGFTGIDCALRV